MTIKTDQATAESQVRHLLDAKSGDHNVIARARGLPHVQEY
jgi:hypothetical protein